MCPCIVGAPRSVRDALWLGMLPAEEQRDLNELTFLLGSCNHALGFVQKFFGVSLEEEVTRLIM